MKKLLSSKLHFHTINNGLKYLFYLMEDTTDLSEKTKFFFTVSYIKSVFEYFNLLSKKFNVPIAFTISTALKEYIPINKNIISIPYYDTMWYTRL